MEKIDISQKISVYGNINDVGFYIKDKNIAQIIEIIYNCICLLKMAALLEKDIDKINITKIVLKNNKIIDNKKMFFLRGYAKEKGNNDESCMRSYFNINYIEVEKLFKELVRLCYSISDFEESKKGFDFAVEYLYLKEKEK